MEDKAYSLKKQARVSGLLYLILIVTGAYCIMYVPSKTIVPGDVAATFKRILSNEFLYRTGIISDIISNAIFVLLGLALYRLLKHVNEHQSRLMVAFVLVQIPAVYIMEALNITSLMIFKGEILQTLQPGQKQDLAILFFKINGYGALILETFWGIWLIPFGQLIYKSRFIPRIFGALLIIAGTAYIIDSLTAILFPNLNSFVKLPTLLLVAIGEISIMFWLLIKGCKKNILPVNKY